MCKTKLHYNRDLEMASWLIANGIKYEEINKQEGYVLFKTTKRYRDMRKLYDMTHA